MTEDEIFELEREECRQALREFEAAGLEPIKVHHFVSRSKGKGRLRRCPVDVTLICNSRTGCFTHPEADTEEFASEAYPGMGREKAEENLRKLLVRHRL